MPPRAPSAARSFSLGGAGTEKPRGGQARRRRRGAERARQRSPAGKFGGRPRLPKFLWAALERGRICGRRERVVPATASCSGHCLRATPLGQSGESARPPPHLLKAPGAEPRPSRTAARVPAAPPPPSTAPRARAPPRSQLLRPHLAPCEAQPGAQVAPKGPLGGASWRGPRVLSGVTGSGNLRAGRKCLGEKDPPAWLPGGVREVDPPSPLAPRSPSFPERRRGGRSGWWGRELAPGSLSAPAAPRAPGGSPTSEPGRPALVLGIARGPEPLRPLPIQTSSPFCCPHPASRCSHRASSVAGFKMRLNESGIGSLEWCLETVICAARVWGIVWQEGLAEPSPDRRSSPDCSVIHCCWFFRRDGCNF